MNKPIYRRSEEVHSEEEMVVEGYAIIFDSPTVLWTEPDGTEYKEVVTSGAFDNTSLENVLLRYNHNDNVPLLARTGNGTMKLTIDEKGLKIRATLADTQQGRDIYKLIKRGDLSALSICFYMGKHEFRGNTNYILGIENLSIKLVDSI